MERAITVGDLNCQRIEIAFSQKSFPALFVRGHGEGPHPCMVFCNGLDSTKEMIFLTMRQELAKRGISCLMVISPGGRSFADRWTHGHSGQREMGGCVCRLP